MGWAFKACTFEHGDDNATKCEICETPRASTSKPATAKKKPTTQLTLFGTAAVLPETKKKASKESKKRKDPPPTSIQHECHFAACEQDPRVRQSALDIFAGLEFLEHQAEEAKKHRDDYKEMAGGYKEMAGGYKEMADRQMDNILKMATASGSASPSPYTSPFKLEAAHHPVEDIDPVPTTESTPQKPAAVPAPLPSSPTIPPSRTNLSGIFDKEDGKKPAGDLSPIPEDPEEAGTVDL